MFHFCHLSKLVRLETYGPYHVYGEAFVRSCKHFFDHSTTVVVQSTSNQMICCVSKLSLTNAVHVGIHYVITNLNSLFLLKTKVIITDFVLLYYAYAVGSRMTSDLKHLYHTFESLPYAVCLFPYILIRIQLRFRIFLRRHRLT